MATLQASASANDPLSMSEVVSHFGQSGTQSLRSYLRNGGVVASSKTTNTNQSAPNANGTTNNFGGVNGLTLAKSETLGNYIYSSWSFASSSSSISYTTNSNDVGDIIYFQFNHSNDGGWRVRLNGTTILEGNNSGGSTYISNYYSRTVNASGQVFNLQAYNAEQSSARYAFRRYSDVYSFTNNTGGSVTVNSTTWSSGSQTISPSGGSYTISYSTDINSSIPTSGTLSLLDFLSADNGA